jgi:hypothetical protein
LIEQLSHYRWSSFPVCAYGKGKAWDWLKTDLIQSQFACKDRNKAYREKAQGVLWGGNPATERGRKGY